MVLGDSHLEVGSVSPAGVVRSAPQTPRNTGKRRHGDQVRGQRTRGLSASRCPHQQIGSSFQNFQNPRAFSLPSCASETTRSLSANPSPRHHSASDSEALTREFFREWTLVSSRSAEGAELVPQDDDNAPNSPCPQTPGCRRGAGPPPPSPPQDLKDRKVSLCVVQRAGQLNQHARHSPSPVRKPSHGLHVQFPASPVNIASAASSSALTDYGSQILVDRVRTPSLDSSSSAGLPSPSSYFRVVVLGATGVGKSSLIGEMAGDTQSDTNDVTDDNDNVLVSVHLDDEESTVELIDCPVDTSMDALRPDAFLVVYSVSDRKSYLTAAEVTRHLRYDLGTDRTVYLVANKTDLRRQQRVTTKEGEQLAAKFDCRFLETSAVLRMNVDTLLVRVLENIRGQLSPPGELTVADAKRCSKNRAPSPRRAIQFLSKLIRPSRGKQNMNNDDMSLKR
ncbi:hypothetical protein BaRGS_00011019 [Batillaria attramentaria]|uniref:GTP-binding protein REM 1 n=1 Tax=Batillaria attramentaria TaxID=370345 RepID=A0ABD0LDI0_9CAEN